MNTPDYEKRLDSFVEEYKVYDKFPGLDSHITWLIAKTTAKLAALTASFVVAATIQARYLKFRGKTPTQVDAAISKAGDKFTAKYDKLERDLVVAEMKLEDEFI